MKGKVLFEEVQTFRYTWSWYLLIAVFCPIVGLFGKGLYTQLIISEPWGGRPMSDSTLIITSVIIFAILLGIFILLHLHELVLQVDEGSIRYKFFPYFSNYKTLEKSDVKEVVVRKYNAILEFGGWGHRRTFSGNRAYNIKGSWGLQIVFQNGKKLLIGTQQPKELNGAIDKLKENWQMQ